MLVVDPRDRNVLPDPAPLSLIPDTRQKLENADFYSHDLKMA